MGRDAVPMSENTPLFERGVHIIFAEIITFLQYPRLCNERYNCLY